MGAQALLGGGIAFVEERPVVDVDFEGRCGGHIGIFGFLELVVGDVGGRHAEVGEHFRAGLDHHGRSAEVELDAADVGMIFEGFCKNDFVNEAGVAVQASSSSGAERAVSKVKL
jgi:hypothetical protein